MPIAKVRSMAATVFADTYVTVDPVVPATGDIPGGSKTSGTVLVPLCVGGAGGTVAGVTPGGPGSSRVVRGVGSFYNSKVFECFYLL